MRTRVTEELPATADQYANSHLALSAFHLQPIAVSLLQVSLPPCAAQASS